MCRDIRMSSGSSSFPRQTLNNTLPSPTIIQIASLFTPITLLTSLSSIQAATITSELSFSLPTSTMLFHNTILAFASVAAAAKPGLLYSRSSFPGVATFNNYAAQSGTVCGSKTGKFPLNTQNVVEALLILFRYLWNLWRCCRRHLS